ncbi:MAG TPA: glycerol kinase GlpK [Solirubrobacterales bacterium]
MSDCVLAIDQGTTGCTVLVVDAAGQLVGRGYREITQYYPEPGWVEHDPEEIWRKTLEAVAEARAAAGQDARLVALGITNQRETTVLWDAATGEPVHPAIVWQDRRTAPLCESLRAAGLADWFADRTGLVIDAYFSGTKIQWLLHNVPDLRARAAAGDLRFGTIDSWLVWKLTNGAVHATDYSNASRTLLLNLETLDWDPEILETLHIPPSLLPRIVPSSGVVAETAGTGAVPAGLPIAGIAGDQQAALFGQACFRPGMVKTTYGTGAFLLTSTGGTRVRSERGLLTTVAWSIDGRVDYALEGSLFIAGAAIQWLRDELGLLKTSAESEEVARLVPDAGGVYLVPAFVGLGAPHWDMYARGTIVGLTRGSSRSHLVRAALESIAYQTRDVVEAMAGEAGTGLGEIRIDGGAAANNLLAQFQADILGVPVVRPKITETTGLGAAYLAGLAVGLWRNQGEIAALWQADRRFHPTMTAETRESLYRGWLRAVERAKGWLEE